MDGIVQRALKRLEASEVSSEQLAPVLDIAWRGARGDNREKQVGEAPLQPHNATTLASVLERHSKHPRQTFYHSNE